VTPPSAPASVSPEALRGHYPHELERTWQPAGASAVTIRPLRPEDLALERRFIEALSPQTLYQRLQYFATSASERDLARLLDLDYYDRLAVGGVTQDATGDTLVGVSRYARIPGTRRAECAIVVADGWQGRGLGSELMRSLVNAAQARDIDWLEGSTLAENARISNWGRRFGFSVHTEPNSGGLVVVKIDLRDLRRSGD